jgi:16S rRNA (guanine527-N7)-methyltransferase
MRPLQLTLPLVPEEAWQRHVCDSLSLLPAIDVHLASSLRPREGAKGDAQTLSVIDVGTGPGLPGVILAVARPSWRFTLLDSMKKRCDFIEQTTTKMGLTNVKVVWSRAEDAGECLWSLRLILQLM